MVVTPDEVSNMTEEEMNQFSKLEKSLDSFLITSGKEELLKEPLTFYADELEKASIRVVHKIILAYQEAGWNLTFHPRGELREKFIQRSISIHNYL